MFYTQFADIFGLGTPEVIAITVVILVLFGGSQLPKLARNIGSSAKELRTGIREAMDEDDSSRKDNQSSPDTTPKDAK